MSFKAILFSAVTLIVGILTGASLVYFYFGSILPKEMMMNIRNGKFTQDMITPPNSTPTTSPVTSPSIPKIEIRHIGGTVESFEGNVMVIKTFSTGTIPQAEMDRIVMIQVLVNEGTKFQSTTPKNMSAFQKELEDFRTMPVEKQKSTVNPPLPFTRVEISRDAFTAGRQVDIESVDAITPQTTTVTAEAISLLPESASVSLGQ
jgi:hypothetical protein